MDGVGASAVVYRLQGIGGAEPEELGRFGIRDRIRALTVDEETPIAVKGDDAWRRAGDYPEFRRYFELVRESGMQKRAPAAEACPNHPDRRSAFGCVTCAAGWCEECVVMPTPGSRIPPLCPKDRSICNPIVYEGTSETLLERCLSAVTYPFAAGGLIYLFFYSVLRLLGGLWFFFPPMTFALLLFLFLAWIYDLEIVRVSAQGQKTLPRFPEGHDVPTWIGRGIKVLVVTLLCWAPFIGYSIWAVKRVSEKVVANVKEELARPPEPSPTTFA